jgi:hypothetical protein
MSLSIQERRVLLPLLKSLKKDGSFKQRSAAQWLLFRLEKPKKGLKEAAKRRAVKRADHAEETSAIRQAVMFRSAGLCEHCEDTFTDMNPAEMDHWLSGIGRRRQKQSIETCWMLCRPCHRVRTAYPELWNGMFQAHCEKYGYPFTPHIVHQPISSTRGPEQINPPDLPAPAREEDEASNG